MGTDPACKRAGGETTRPLPDRIRTATERMRAEPATGARVYLSSTRREPLVHGGEVVGFVTPHETPSGWRHGPIFVLPAFRGKGLVEAYYAAHPERLCVAFIPAAAKASLRMHRRAGFRPWRKHAHGVWLRREPLR